MPVLATSLAATAVSSCRALHHLHLHQPPLLLRNVGLHIDPLSCIKAEGQQIFIFCAKKRKLFSLFICVSNGVYQVTAVYTAELTAVLTTQERVLPVTDLDSLVVGT